jgi:hypothetical protein
MLLRRIMSLMGCLYLVVLFYVLSIFFDNKILILLTFQLTFFFIKYLDKCLREMCDREVIIVDLRRKRRKMSKNCFKFLVILMLFLALFYETYIVLKYKSFMRDFHDRKISFNKV